MSKNTTHTFEEAKGLFFDSGEDNNISMEDFTFQDFNDYFDLMGLKSFNFRTLGNDNRLKYFLKRAVPDDVELSFEEQARHLDIDNKAEEAQKNGRFCSLTAIYPGNLTPSVIKHIYTEDISLIDRLDKSIWRRISLNHGIYQFNTNDPLTDIDWMNVVQNSEKLDVDWTENLKDNLLRFKNTGEIEYANSDVPVDLGIMLGIAEFHRLILRPDGIHLMLHSDSNWVLPYETTYSELIKTWTDMLASFENKYHEYPLALRKIFLLLLSIVVNSESGLVTFVTPFNGKNARNEFLPNYQWIGYKTQDTEYVEQLESQRTFKVNNDLLTVFDQVIKKEPSENDSADEKEVRRILNEYR